MKQDQKAAIRQTNRDAQRSTAAYNKALAGSSFAPPFASGALTDTSAKGAPSSSSSRLTAFRIASSCMVLHSRKREGLLGRGCGALVGIVGRPSQRSTETSNWPAKEYWEYTERWSPKPAPG